MRDNFLVRVEENNGRVPVNLTKGTTAFPEPTFSWTRDGQLLIGPDLTYSSVTFENVRRMDAGNYTVSATNFILNSTTEQVGNDTGSFYLDVLCKSLNIFNSEDTVVICITSLLESDKELFNFPLCRWSIFDTIRSSTMLCSVE